MSNKTHLRITEVDDSIKLEVEGSLKDLVNLVANTIDENEDIERILALAFVAVQIKREKDNGDEDDDNLTELLGKFKPRAQA